MEKKVNSIFPYSTYLEAIEIRKVIFNNFNDKGFGNEKHYYPLKRIDDKITINNTKLHDSSYNSIPSTEFITISVQEICQKLKNKNGVNIYGLKISKILKSFTESDREAYIFSGIIELHPNSLNKNEKKIVIKIVKLNNKELCSTRISCSKKNIIELYRNIYRQKCKFIGNIDNSSEESNGKLFNIKNPYDKKKSDNIIDIVSSFSELSMFDNDYYLNEIWQEVVTYSSLYSHSYYGHINFCFNGDYYTMLILRKFEGDLYRLVNAIILKYKKKDISEESFCKNIKYILAQLFLITLPLSRNNGFRHNDSKIDNYGYIKTDVENIYLEVSSLSVLDGPSRVYSIPTKGRLYCPFDFGWACWQDKTEDSCNNYFSEVPFKNFKANSLMFVENPFTDLIQIVYSLLRIFEQRNILKKYKLREYKSDRFSELINFLLEMKKVDEFYREESSSIIYRNINTDNIDIKILDADEKWGETMYVPLSELFTYTCKKRQSVLLNFFEEFRIKEDVNDIILQNKGKQFPHYVMLDLK